MTAKGIGAVLIIGCCGGCGFSMANSQRKEEQMLESLHSAILFMLAQLRFCMESLPELCRSTARHIRGNVRRVLLTFAGELDQCVLSDAAGCMRLSLQTYPQLPASVYTLLERLGRCLGRFDLPGQLQSLEDLDALCCRMLEELRSGREARHRSYRILGVCAGIALTILLI